MLVSTKNTPGLRLIGLTATMLATTMEHGAAIAQTVLPEVVVRGATIAAPPVRKAAETDEPGAPSPKPRPAPSTQSSAAAGNVPSSPSTSSGGAPAPGAGRANTGGDTAGGIATDRVGTAVTVVTSDDLKRQNIRDAADALRSLPGVEVSRSGSFSGKTQVRIRGAEGNHTLVMIDGIQANDPNDGEFDFANLLTDDIDRIEVIRGAQSGLYGSGAIGGVVNIITRSGKGPLTVAVRAEAGSFRTTTASARVSGGNDRAWISLSAQQRRSDGYNVSLEGLNGGKGEHDGSTLANFSAKAGVKVTDDITTELVLRNSRNRLERDGYGAFTLGSLSKPYDDASKSMNTVWQAGITTRWDMLDGKLSHVFKANQTTSQVFDDDASFFSKTLNNSRAEQLSYAATYRFETPMIVAVKHSLTGMIEKRNEAFTPSSDFADGIERQRGLIGTVGEWRGEIADRLFLQGSVRHDDHDAFGEFNTWRTSASLKLNEWGLRPHASMGTGVRLPTMFEQFGFIPAFFTPNPDLRPELSKGWDAGVETTLVPGKLSVDVTYFHTNLTDKIDGLAAGPGFTFTAKNLTGESLREGVETSGKLRLTNEITVSAAHTYLTAVDSTGVQELRRPRNAARVDLNYAFMQGRGNFNVAAVYNGQMADRTSQVTGFSFGFPTTAPLRVTLDDYWLLSAGASYKLQPGVEIYGRIENVLNERYQEVYGYNTPGLAAYAGVRFTYEDKKLLAQSSETSGR